MFHKRRIDEAYADGKAAYLRDIGTHGPTLRPTVRTYTPNPYPDGLYQLRLAWERGYHQDTRRVVA